MSLLWPSGTRGVRDQPSRAENWEVSEMATYKTSGPDGTEIHVGEAHLARFAMGTGLDKIAPGRYSKLFAFKLLLYTQFQGVEADFIIEEVKALEGLPNRAVNTKPATQSKAARTL